MVNRVNTSLARTHLVVSYLPKREERKSPLKKRKEQEQSG